MHQGGAAAIVAFPLNPRPVKALVIAGAAFRAGETPDEARDQLGLIDLHQDHTIELAAALGEHRVERLGLRYGARKAVEDEAAGAIGLVDPSSNHLDHD